jgi:hypothetical protein
MARHLWTAAVAAGLCVGWAQGRDAGFGPPAESAVTVDGVPPAGNFQHTRCAPAVPVHFALRVTGARSVEGSRVCPGGAPRRHAAGMPIC